MKIKFVLKAKDLNKKWLKSVKSLYGKQKLVISIEPDNGEEADFDFDDDSWWGEDEDDFALEIDNEIDNDFNAEEYLASIEQKLAEESEKAEKTEKEKKPARKKKEIAAETPKEEDVVKPAKKIGRPKKEVEETVGEEKSTTTKNKGGRPQKKVAETVVESAE